MPWFYKCHDTRDRHHHRLCMSSMATGTVSIVWHWHWHWHCCHHGCPLLPGMSLLHGDRTPLAHMIATLQCTFIYTNYTSIRAHIQFPIYFLQMSLHQAFMSPGKHQTSSSTGHVKVAHSDTHQGHESRNHIKHVGVRGTSHCNQRCVMEDEIFFSMQVFE